MEATNEVFVPIGFRFRPTDEELIVHYLTLKAMSLPLPASVIPEAEVFRCSPCDLPGDLKEVRFFFSKGGEVTTHNEKKVRTSDGSGFWKVTGKEKDVVLGKKGKEVIGVRKRMTFFDEKSSDGQKFTWVMHEIKLIQKPEVGDWIVYRIFKKKNRAKPKNKLNNNNRVCPSVPPPPPTSSPCSSVITQ